MNAKRELIAFAVRIVASKTSLIRQPDSFELLLNNMFGVESYDQRLARVIEADLERANSAVKQKIVDRKFKKITENI